MALELVQQPAGSNQCGQACVAMIAGVPLARAVEVVGCKGKTTAKKIRQGLAALGFHMVVRGRRMERFTTHWWESTYWAREGVFLCRVHYPGTKATHWVVLDHGRILDPGGQDCTDMWTLRSIVQHRRITAAYAVVPAVKP